MGGFAERTVNEICAAMNRAHISQRELAKRLGVTEARISQILRPESNMTLRSVDRILAAIDGFDQ
nr:helix-turn-helix transcriptional regulator [Sphingomonas sp. Y57]